MKRSYIAWRKGSRRAKRAAADVQRFAELYVATSVLANAIPPQQRCFCALPERIEHAAARVPLSDKRKEHAFFLHKDVAAQIQIPSRRMLREHAQRRTEAVGKQRWAKYQASEGNGLGQTHSTSPGEGSLNPSPSAAV